MRLPHPPFSFPFAARAIALLSLLTSIGLIVKSLFANYNRSTAFQQDIGDCPKGGNPFKNESKGAGKRMNEAQAPQTEDARSTKDRGGKYLTFSLADEEYGIGILKIKEIIGMMPVTTVPQAPEFFKGVINLRGKVIPVIDLRLKFGMPPIEYSERTCIVVVETEGPSGSILMGSVVDSVSEVLNIKEEDVEDPPTFGTRLNTDAILGMAKMEEGVKILLDIDHVLDVKRLMQMDDFL
jgi:purine-binding chemotaxis protein CheW